MTRGLTRGAGDRGRGARAPAPAREADLLRASLQYLAACRLVAWRSNVIALPLTDRQGARRYVHSLPKGFADITAVIPPDGRHVYIECKARRGRLTPWQDAWQARMRAAGCLVLTIKSLEELRQGLRAAGVAAP